MSNLPRVSIVTPSFNQAPFLEQTLRSVLDQDYAGEIEYIVMDGGSTDGSVEIIRRHAQHLAAWFSERDGGQSAAINRGFRMSTGSILAWLNSDDLLAPSAVRIAIDALGDSSVGVVYGDRMHIDARGNVIGVKRCPPHDPRMFRRNITLPQETVFFRREHFEKVGALDESLAFSMDFDLWVRFAQITTLKHVPAFIGYYREHFASKSTVFHEPGRSEADKYLAEHQRVFRKHFGRELPGKWISAWHRAIARACLAMHHHSKSGRAEARRLRELVLAPATPVLIRKSA